MNDLLRDVRYSARGLLRHRGFTTVVILVLALGIGANTAIFNVIYQVLLKALPYGHPDSLVMLWETNQAAGELVGGRIPVARKNFEEWRRQQNRIFERIEAFDRISFTVTGNGGAPDRVKAAEATMGFFQVLRVTAKLGRTFVSAEITPGKNHVAIISYGFFKTHFGLDPSVVGKSLLLDNIPYEIVGVLPEEFKLPSFYQGRDQYKADIWVPMVEISAQDSPLLLARRWLLVVARLRDGVNVFQARSEMEAISRRLAQQDPKLDSGYSATVFPIAVENEDPSVHRALYLMFAAVVFVYLIACANLANLMLARGMGRQKELAIQMALGATPQRVIRKLIIESAILVSVGAIFGLVVAYGGIRLIVALKPGDIHGIEELGINVPAALLTTVLSVATGIIFALLPGWLAIRRHDVNDLLKYGGERTSSGEVAPLVRRVLVSAQVAVAVLLTMGATLTVRSFIKVLNVDSGFHADNLLTARVVLPVTQYAKVEKRIDFTRRLVEKIKYLPGVDSVSLIDNLPLLKIRYTYFQIEGRPNQSPSDIPVTDMADVTPDFLKTLGVLLKTGRRFTDADTTENANVVLINQTMAVRYWPAEDPLQKHIREISLTGEPGPLLTIIGVIGDYHQLKIENPTRPQMFRASWNLRAMTILARTSSKPFSLAPALQRAVWDIDKDQPLTDIQTMQEVVTQDLSQRRFNMLLLGIFAGIAVFIGMVGVYGVVSYIVASRIPEIAIRIALGAQRPNLLLWFLWRSFILAGVGVLVGLGLSFAARRLLDSVLFEISPMDTATYIAVPMIMLAVAMLASAVPAWRAAMVDPALILRKG